MIRVDTVITLKASKLNKIPKLLVSKMIIVEKERIKAPIHQKNIFP